MIASIFFMHRPFLDSQLLVPKYTAKPAAQMYRTRFAAQYASQLHTPRNY
jgi:hypothetical protein